MSATRLSPTVNLVWVQCHTVKPQGTWVLAVIWSLATTVLRSWDRFLQKKKKGKKTISRMPCRAYLHAKTLKNHEQLILPVEGFFLYPPPPPFPPLTCWIRPTSKHTNTAVKDMEPQGTEAWQTKVIWSLTTVYSINYLPLRDSYSHKSLLQSV